MLDFFFLNISINFEHFLKVVVLVTQNAKLHFWVRLPVAYLYSFLREAYSHIGHVSSKANINVIVLRLANDDYRAHFRVGLPAIRHIRHNGTAHVTPLLSGIHFWLVCRRIV